MSQSIYNSADNSTSSNSQNIKTHRAEGSDLSQLRDNILKALQTNKNIFHVNKFDLWSLVFDFIKEEVIYNIEKDSVEGVEDLAIAEGRIILQTIQLLLWLESWLQIGPPFYVNI